VKRTHWSAIVIVVLSLAAQGRPTKEAKEILRLVDAPSGLLVHLGCGEGQLTKSLAEESSCLVHGLDGEEASIEKARAFLRAEGLQGRVSVMTWEEQALPYADRLVNCLVVSDHMGISREELHRVLAPGGILVEKSIGGEWRARKTSWPEGMDHWTHYLHDASGNAVSHDVFVAPPNRIQWSAGPLYARSHEIDNTLSALVSAQGRLFYFLDEGLTGITDARLSAQWSLVARDAFNGLELWRRELPDWGWRQWKRAELEGKDWTGVRGQRTRSPLIVPRRLVAGEDHVFVTLGYDAPVSVLDAGTGETLKRLEETEFGDEILLDEDRLLVVVRDPQAKEAARRSKVEGVEEIAAVQLGTWETLWRREAPHVLPLLFSAGEDRVIYHDGKSLVCLDASCGEEQWKRDTGKTRAGYWGGDHTLVIREGVVLFLGSQKLSAFSLRNGETLWEGEGGKGPGVSNPPDLFVADGLVWYGGGGSKKDRQKTSVARVGFDLKTGQPRRTVEVDHLISPGHHFRCYRSKATDRFLLWPKRGVEFIDLCGQEHMRHDWLRGACKLGFMPANGLLYMPPHQCFCYPGAKVVGFNALSAGRLSFGARDEMQGDRLWVGREPRKGKVRPGTEDSSDPGDWPTYRHDHERSGSTRCGVDLKIDSMWCVPMAAPLTSPVVSNGTVLVASAKEHTLYALDGDTGKQRWQYTPGGRIDSPPTVYQEEAIFGCRDGYIYCLDLKDGCLLWRFRAAPRERLICSEGQLESAWPVHGSVLLLNDVVYAAAGRSSFLDGGIFLYGLDPDTGAVLYHAREEGPYPDPNQDVGRPFDMDGTKADVLVSDGEFLFMQQSKFDAKLRPQSCPRQSDLGDREMGLHLLSTASLLDGTWWNRTFWMYSSRWPGYYIANQAPKAGQLLVFDEEVTYGVKCFTRRNRHSPMFFPNTDGYLLFADRNDNEPILVDENEKPTPLEWLPAVNPAIGHKLDGQALNKDKATGWTRLKPALWTSWVPVRARAMVLTGVGSKPVLFVAGPPDELDGRDPMAVFEGRSQGCLWALSGETGEVLAQYDLKCPARFDGMIAAKGRLYLSRVDGVLECLG